MKCRIKTYKDTGKNGSIKYILLSIVASAINAVTLVAFGRAFPVKDYATISTFQAFLSNINVVVIPLQYLICKALAREEETGADEVNGIIRIFFLLNMILGVCLVIFSNKFTVYLNFQQKTDYILFSFLVIITNLYLLLTGAIQGKQLFSLLGRIGIIFYAGKLTVGLLLSKTGIGPTAVVIGSVIADIICCIIMLVSLRNASLKGLRVFSSIPISIVKKYIKTLITYYASSIYMNNMDIIIANMYTGGEEIGLYSVAINLTKMSVFLIATPFATLLLPKVASEKNIEQKRVKTVKVLLITSILSLLFECFIILFKDWLIHILYGSEYQNAGNYLLSCGIFSVVLGIFWVFYHYSMVSDIEDIFFKTSATIGVVMTITLIVLKPTISIIPFIMTGSMVLTIAVSIIASRNRLQALDNMK